MTEDFESFEIPVTRYFHYEKFPGLIGPKERRFIFLEWLYLLAFNAWSYIFKKPVHRTLIKFVDGPAVPLVFFCDNPAEMKAMNEAFARGFDRGVAGKIPQPTDKPTEYSKERGWEKTKWERADEVTEQIKAGKFEWPK